MAGLRTEFRGLCTDVLTEGLVLRTLARVGDAAGLSSAEIGRLLQEGLGRRRKKLKKSGQNIAILLEGMVEKGLMEKVGSCYRVK